MYLCCLFIVCAVKFTEYLILVVFLCHVSKYYMYNEWMTQYYGISFFSPFIVGEVQ